MKRRGLRKEGEKGRARHQQPSRRRRERLLLRCRSSCRSSSCCCPSPAERRRRRSSSSSSSGRRRRRGDHPSRRTTTPGVCRRSRSLLRRRDRRRSLGRRRAPVRQHPHHLRARPAQLPWQPVLQAGQRRPGGQGRRRVPQLVEERVGHRLQRGRALSRSVAQQPRDQVHGLGGHALGEHFRPGVRPDVRELEVGVVRVHRGDLLPRRRSQDLDDLDELVDARLARE